MPPPLPIQEGQYNRQHDIIYHPDELRSSRPTPSITPAERERQRTSARDWALRTFGPRPSQGGKRTKKYSKKTRHTKKRRNNKNYKK